MFKLTRYMLKVLWLCRDRWTRILLAARLMGVMKSEFGDAFGQPHIMILDEHEFDEWTMGLAYTSTHGGIHISIDIFDNRIELFAATRDSELSYFLDDVTSVEEARSGLREFYRNMQRDLQEVGIWA